MSDQKNQALNNLSQLTKEYESAIENLNQTKSELAATKSNLDNLKASYEALEKNSSAEITKNSKKNRELLAQLEAKEQALVALNV